MRLARTEFGRWLLGATLLGAIVRVAWLANRWNDPIGFEDAFFYHHQANLLADGQGFVSPFPLLSSGISWPAAEHPPLFSLYLAVWSFLGATSVGWHQLATTVLGIGTVALIGFAGREAGGDRVGIIAAFIAAIYPHLWFQDGIVWAEASAQAAVALFVLVAYRYVRRPSLRTLATLGLAASIAAMARTELVLLLPLGVIPLALLDPRASPRRSGPVGSHRGGGRPGRVGARGCCSTWPASTQPTTLSSNVGLTLASANCDTTWYGPTIGYWDFRCAQAAGTEGRPHRRRSVGDRRRGPGRGAGLHQRQPRSAPSGAGRPGAAGVGPVVAHRSRCTIDMAEGRPEPVARAGVPSWWLVLVLAAVGVVALRRVGIPSWPAVAPVVVDADRRPQRLCQHPLPSERRTRHGRAGRRRRRPPPRPAASPDRPSRRRAPIPASRWSTG